MGGMVHARGEPVEAAAINVREWWLAEAEE